MKKKSQISMVKPNHSTFKFVPQSNAKLWSSMGGDNNLKGRKRKVKD